MALAPDLFANQIQQKAIRKIQKIFQSKIHWKMLVLQPVTKFIERTTFSKVPPPSISLDGSANYTAADKLLTHNIGK